MSARALRKLREDRDNAKTVELDDVEEEEEEEETKPKVSAFAMMDDSSDEDESDDDDNDNVDDKRSDGDNEEKDQEINQYSVARAPAVSDDDAAEEEEEEDLDAILAEFQDEQHLKVDDAEMESRCFVEIVDGLEARDLDFESVLRNVLLGCPTEEQLSTSTRRGGRQASLFGPPRDGWTRPPHFVGGGIGMTTYDQHPQPLPWPYNEQGDKLEGAKEAKHWFTFMHSDTSKKELEQYSEIQQSSDVNALCLFVADNPFVPEALLQLAKVVYQTNQSPEALALLRRALWIYECTALKSFTPHNINNTNCFVDCDQKENKTFFQALFLLMQVSSIAGCTRTSLAVTRYVLAMDPLRDPMCALVALDFFALSTKNIAHDMFVVNLVEKGEVKLHYRDEESTEFVGMLTEMPNWAFSYALALYRVEQSRGEPVGEDSITSRDALVSAIRKYPEIVEELLRKNEISTSGRSTQTDWPPVLQSLRQLALPPSQHRDYDPIVYYATKSASDLIAKIFVQRSFKLWGGSDVQKWLYDAAVEATSGHGRQVEFPSPALQRYARIDPADYEDRLRLLPAEANPLDPGLLAISLVVDTNRRRMLRRGDRAARVDPLEALENRARAGQQGIVIGGPPTHDIDPDSPLLEVLLQSMLPWNRVEGVPPPGR